MMKRLIVFTLCLAGVAFAKPPPARVLIHVDVEDELLPSAEGRQPTPVGLEAQLYSELPKWGFDVTDKPAPGAWKLSGKAVFQPHSLDALLGAMGGGPMGPQSYYPVTGEVSLVVHDPKGKQVGTLNEKLGMDALRVGTRTSPVIDYQRTAYDLARTGAPSLVGRLTPFFGGAPHGLRTLLIDFAETGKDFAGRSGYSLGLLSELRAEAQRRDGLLMVPALMREGAYRPTCRVSGETTLQHDKPKTKPFRLNARWSLVVEVEGKKSKVEGTWAAEGEQTATEASARNALEEKVTKAVASEVLAKLKDCLSEPKP